MSKKPNKRKSGRKSKYDTVILPRLDEIAEMLKLGATDKEIAENLKVAPQTFCEYKTRYPEFNEFIKDNRKTPILQIKAALFKRACGYEYVEKKKESQFIQFPKEIKEWLAESGLGDVIDQLEQPALTKVTETTKFVVPDPASAMILLKHWARDEGWTNDPAQLELKKKEFEFRKEQAEKDNW